MADQITGKVKHILSGDSFVLDVTQKTSTGQYRYNNEETIFIPGILAKPYGEPGFEQDKTLLSDYLKEKTVTCSIFTRDDQARLVCKIEQVT